MIIISKVIMESFLLNIKSCSFVNEGHCLDVNMQTYGRWKIYINNQDFFRF